VTGNLKRHEPAPAAGPYSPAVRAGDWLVCSGQLGVRAVPGGVELVQGGLGPQARQALSNVAELLGAHGLDWSSVVKVTVFLASPGSADKGSVFAKFNEVYSDVLRSHRPARSAVMVESLPLGALVEVEVWAYAGSGRG